MCLVSGSDKGFNKTHMSDSCVIVWREVTFVVYKKTTRLHHRSKIMQREFCLLLCVVQVPYSEFWAERVSEFSALVGGVFPSFERDGLLNKITTWDSRAVYKHSVFPLLYKFINMAMG